MVFFFLSLFFIFWFHNQLLRYLWYQQAIWTFACWWIFDPSVFKFFIKNILVSFFYVIGVDIIQLLSNDFLVADNYILYMISSGSEGNLDLIDDKADGNVEQAGNASNVGSVGDGKGLSDDSVVHSIDQPSSSEDGDLREEFDQILADQKNRSDVRDGLLTDSEISSISIEVAKDLSYGEQAHKKYTDLLLEEIKLDQEIQLNDGYKSSEVEDLVDTSHAEKQTLLENLSRTNAELQRVKEELLRYPKIYKKERVRDFTDHLRDRVHNITTCLDNKYKRKTKQYIQKVYKRLKTK